jgi:hypothetical protein
MPVPQMSQPTWDVFVSYASEDRNSLAGPLVKMLSGMGSSVWWDELELQLGDSLSSKIDYGLSKSTFGVVIISEAFLAKRWPEYELRGLVAREIAGSKVILPIWHGVTFDYLVQVSPTLAEKKAYQLRIGFGKDELVAACLEIMKVVRPDLLTHLHRRVAHELERRRGGNPTDVDPRKLVFAPIRHDKLPDDLYRRIRLIRAALMFVNPHSMKYWLEGFRRDAHPSGEVAIWERIAAAFLEFLGYKLATGHDLSAEQKQAAYSFFVLFTQTNQSATLPLIESLEGDRELLEALISYKQPIIEVNMPEEDDAWNPSVDADPEDLPIEDFDHRFNEEEVQVVADHYQGLVDQDNSDN